MGESYKFDLDLIIPDKTKSIKEGCIATIKKDDGTLIFSDFGRRNLRNIANEMHFSLDTPWNKLKKAQQDAVLYGTPRRAKSKR